jgi:hypothetical protein
MSTIAAGTSAGTALVSTGNTDGTLQLQVNGTTPSVTLAANGSIGVGSSPSYGTNGQLLTSSGTGSAPTWTTLSASGLTLLSTVTASASSTVDLETTFNSTYDTYMIVVSELVQTTSGNLCIRMKIGGSYLTTSTYKYFVEGMTSVSPSFYADNSNADTSILVGSQVATAGATGGFVIYVNSPSNTSIIKQIHWNGIYTTTTSDPSVSRGVALNTGTGALTGIRFFNTGGQTIASGKFRLYGLANS